jgi:CRISPR system Cascade subunit CasE
MTAPLYLINIPLDMAHLFRLGARPTFTRHAPDLGYLVHSQLVETFGALAPKPFALVPHAGRDLRVLAYSGAPVEALRTAAGNAPPGVRATVRWPDLQGKALPETFPPGHHLRFRIRACPVVRKSAQGPVYGAGAEIDAFLAAVEKVDRGVALDRQTVYREWFLGAVARRGGMRCVDLAITAMQRVRLTRRDQARAPTPVERPDVVFEGVLEVADPAAFRTTLATGIGRHRAFGFGMLLLRPV